MDQQCAEALAPAQPRRVTDRERFLTFALAAAEMLLEVSPDGRQANIKVELFGSAEEQKEAMAALHHSAGFLRHQVATRMELRHAPELLFLSDSGMSAQARVETLLQRVKKNRRGPENEGGS